jgi:hypothetical protein
MATLKPILTKMSAYQLELLHALLGGVTLTRKDQPSNPRFPVYYELTQEGHKPRYASEATVDGLVKLQCLVSADNVTFTLSAAARASLTPPAVEPEAHADDAAKEEPVSEETVAPEQNPEIAPAEEQSDIMQVATNEGRPIMEEQGRAAPKPAAKRPASRTTNMTQAWRAEVKANEARN